MFGILKKVAGYGTGITPARKLLGLDPREVNADAYENPFFQKQFAEDRNRSSFYNKRAETGFGGMNTAGKNINRNAAGYGGLISRLSDMGQGKGPSLAQMQLEQATNRNIQNQAGIAASNQGYNPAMAARLMGQNVAGMNQEAAGQSGQLRLQEQMDAINQEIAAREAQGQAYGMAGNLMSNQANLGMQGGFNYQNMAQALAEQERAARMARESGNNSAYETAMGRRLGFLSKAGQAIAGAS